MKTITLTDDQFDTLFEFVDAIRKLNHDVNC